MQLKQNIEPMKILIDINVFMDVLTRRKGWLESLATIKILKPYQISGYISALTTAVIYFLRLRSVGEMKAREEVRMVSKDFVIVPLTRPIIQKALDSKLPEFEDNIQFFSARQKSVDYLVTRNKKHFRQDVISVLTPDEFLKAVGILN